MTPVLPDLWRHLAPLRSLPYGPRWPSEVDCSTLVAHVVQEHYGTGRDVWQAVSLSLPDAGPWDGVVAVAEALGTDPCLPYHGPHQPMPGRLHYVQGWSGLSAEGAIVRDTPSRRGSRGHAWLWLAFGAQRHDGTAPPGGVGVCIEANRPQGARLWDGRGVRDLADVVAEDGRLVAEIAPLDWDVRASYHEHAWVVLP